MQHFLTFLYERFCQSVCEKIQASDLSAACWLDPSSLTDVLFIAGEMDALSSARYADAASVDTADQRLSFKPRPHVVLVWLTFELIRRIWSERPSVGQSSSSFPQAESHLLDLFTYQCSCWMLSGVCDVAVKQEHVLLGGGADVSPCTAVRYRSGGWN